MITAGVSKVRPRVNDSNLLLVLQNLLRDKRRKSSAASHLLWSFNFMTAPQGHVFWWEVYHKLFSQNLCEEDYKWLQEVFGATEQPIFTDAEYEELWV